MRVHITSKGSGQNTIITDLRTGEQVRDVTEIRMEPIVAGDLVRCVFVTRATLDVDAEVYGPFSECVRLRAENRSLSERVKELEAIAREGRG